jgi:hypothetical protein
VAEETPPRYCSVCRHELKPEDLSCPKCGTPVILAAEVPTPEADRLVPPHPFEVEQQKPQEERGRYLEPSLYDAPEEQRVMIGPIPEAVEEGHRRLIDELSG